MREYLDVSKDALLILGLLLQRLGGEVTVTQQDCIAAREGKILVHEMPNGDVHLIYRSSEL